MQTYALTAHPAHLPAQVSGVEARVIGFDADWLRVRWRIEGAQGLVVPPFAGRGRAVALAFDLDQRFEPMHSPARGANDLVPECFEPLRYRIGPTGDRERIVGYPDLHHSPPINTAILSASSRA